jgi:hypothetical protein
MNGAIIRARTVPDSGSRHCAVDGRRATPETRTLRARLWLMDAASRERRRIVPPARRLVDAALMAQHRHHTFGVCKCCRAPRAIGEPELPVHRQ